MVSTYTIVLYDPDSTTVPPTRIFCASLLPTAVPPTTAIPVGSDSCYQACAGGEFINITTGLCTECSPCATGFYSQGGCVNVTDTMCVPHTDCASVLLGRTRSRTQLRAGNATHDTECVDCAVCSPFEFESAACTVSSDTVCQMRDTCTAGSTFENSFGSPFANRDCRLCNPCLGSEYTARSCNLLSDTACLSKRTSCAQGDYRSAVSSLTSDIACSSCAVCMEASDAVAPLAACAFDQDTVCPTTTTTTATATVTTRTVVTTFANTTALGSEDDGSGGGGVVGLAIGTVKPSCLHG